MKITREEFGAKSANLAAISPVIAELDTDNVVGPIEIPEFEAVSTRLYERWMNREMSGADVWDLFKRAQVLSAKGDGVMVRSSAVLGEDSQISMGAGVYESVRLDPGFNPLDFYVALSKVYKSTSSAEAIAYLEQLGIDPSDERMGILLQTYPSDLDMNSTIDSKVAGNPNLMSVRTIDLDMDKDKYDNYGSLRRSRIGQAVLDRQKVEAVKHGPLQDHPSRYRDLYHVVPDVRKFREGTVPIALAKTALSIESAMGSAVQIEAVDSRNQDQVEHRGWNKFWIVQERPLVRDVDIEQTFEGFPEDKQVLYGGRGVGVVNGATAQVQYEDSMHISSPESLLNDLKKLPDDEMRLLVFRGSFAMSGTADKLTTTILKLAPDSRKKVAVLVRSSSEMRMMDNRGGHFETMCLELGIPCIFYSPTSDDFDQMYNVKPNDKVKIYSNGYKARLYPV